MKITKLKLSNRDKKLLLIVCALMILLGTYRFVYFSNMQQYKTLLQYNKQLRLEESELILKNEKLEEIQKENIQFKEAITDLIDSYGSGAAFEKTILFFKNMEEETGIDISVIGFTDPEYIYTANEAESVPVPEENNSEEGNSQVQGEAAPAIPITGSNDSCGYNSAVSIEFKVNYEGLKKSIDFINQSSERKNIREMNLVYDLETGNLSGSMVINMYHLTDTGKPVEEPAIAGVSIGTDNIFGTIEVPMGTIEVPMASLEVPNS